VQQMSASQEFATAAALSELGYQLDMTLTVAELMPELPAAEVLEVGDVVTAITPAGGGTTELRDFGQLIGVLAELRPDGELHEPSQEFCPYFIPAPVNDDPDAKATVLATITEWLDGNPEDAESLLSHIATALAPHWSAVKYVLLIGEGRNGKSAIPERAFSSGGCSGLRR